MSELLETLDKGVLTLTFNRPDRQNAMTEPLADAFTDAVRRAAKDPAVRCVALTGAGRAFSAGGDMEGMQSFQASEIPLDERVELLRKGTEVVELLHEMPKPTVALINGAAAGAGLVFALACDMRFSLDTAKLTTAFVKIGACGDSGLSYFLPRIVGPAKAYELMYLSDVLTGQEARDIGLVTKTAPAAEFGDAARAFAQRLGDLPTVAVGLMKQNLVRSHSASLGEVLDLESANMIRSFDTEDHKNAVQAFMNKQQPKFEGR